MYSKLQLETTRARIAASADFGIPGTLRLGSPDADGIAEVYVISSFVYEGEEEGVAAQRYLMELGQSLPLKQDVQICLLVARPDVREETNNLNRLRNTWAAGNWEAQRAVQITDAFDGLTVGGVLDLQTNKDPLDPSGWAIVIKDGGPMVPCGLCIEELTEEQKRATGTAPFATLFDAPSIEMLTWPGRWGQVASVEAALSWLAAHECFAFDRTKKVRKVEQRVLRVTGHVKVPDASKAYVLNANLSPIADIDEDHPIGVSADGELEIVPETSGVLILATRKIKANDADNPVGYVTEEDYLDDTVESFTLVE